MSILCDKHYLVIKEYEDGSYRVICKNCEKEFKVKDFSDAYPDVLIHTYVILKLLKRERDMK